MTGWLIALVLAGATFVFLAAGRNRTRDALEVVAAAVVLALAGYAWQGSPGMPGHPVSPATGQTTPN
ncbi:MAG: hypothetical protein GC147_08075 [Porphyrobacter sp.]|nr:hypothetical protein [Porphyrobacter sp.]